MAVSVPGGATHTTSKRGARIAGVCYLLVIAGGIFAALFVREALFVPNDAATTARAIAASDGLWRWGVAVHALYLLPAAAFSVILYRLFRPVQPTLALLALVFGVAPVAIEGVLLTTLHVPMLLSSPSGLAAMPDAGQRDAFTHLAVRLFLSGWGISLLLFSGFCALTGVLILRSRLVPRAIGVLMIGAGAGYFLNSLTAIVAPPLNAALLPGILLLPFLGEASLALWLAIRGVRVS